MNTLEQVSVPAVKTVQPTPMHFFDTMNAYQRTAALKAAIDLDLFSVIGETSGSISEIAERLTVPERGVRILCNYLVVIGFLSKFLDESKAHYGLTPDSAMFLDKKSPAYLGTATVFLASPLIAGAFKDIAAVVRAGGPESSGQHVDGETEAWVDFARGMAPMMYPIAEKVSTLLDLREGAQVLDIAAGHGLYGIAVARHNPTAHIVAMDWPAVLAVAKENAGRFGVSDRYSLLAGDALKVPFGEGFDVVLVPNLLHHWDRETIDRFLQKVYEALSPGGQIVVVEFTPNDDRVSPPVPASFALSMLALTSVGDAYTLSENLQMLRNAGFTGCAPHPLLPFPQTAIVATKG